MSLTGNRPPFFGLKTGDLVLVQPSADSIQTSTDWWMGWIVRRTVGADVNSGQTLYEVADVDSGEVRSVNSELVTRLVLTGMEANKVVPLVRL